MRSYLASEENFNVAQGARNEEPARAVVGNFAGPKAIRAVGAWLKAHNGMVSAFYLSNVEQYLQHGRHLDGLLRATRRALPIDDSSQFIRSYRGGGGPGFGGGASLNQGLFPMVADLKLCQ